MPDEPGTQAPEEASQQPTQEAPPAPQPGTEEASQTPDYFDEKFDPASLSEELRPAYKQMRDAFSQKTQSLAEQRREAETALRWFEAYQNPETQAQALDALGLELADAEQEGYEFEEPDPNEAMAQDLEAIKAYLQGQASEQQQLSAIEEEHGYMDDQFDRLEERIGRELDDDEVEWIAMRAQAERDDQGLPDVGGAYDQWSDLSSKQKQKWVESKRAPRVGTGTSARHQPDLDDPSARRDYMEERLKTLEEG